MTNKVLSFCEFVFSTIENLTGHLDQITAFGIAVSVVISLEVIKVDITKRKLLTVLHLALQHLFNGQVARQSCQWAGIKIALLAILDLQHHLLDFPVETITCTEKFTGSHFIEDNVAKVFGGTAQPIHNFRSLMNRKGHCNQATQEANQAESHHDSLAVANRFLYVRKVGCRELIGNLLQRRECHQPGHNKNSSSHQETDQNVTNKG